MIRNINYEGGYKAYFKGNGVNCLKVAPETAIKFYLFDYIKNIFCKNAENKNENPNLGQRFISGGIAGCIA